MSRPARRPGPPSRSRRPPWTRKGQVDAGDGRVLPGARRGRARGDDLGLRLGRQGQGRPVRHCHAQRQRCGRTQAGDLRRHRRGLGGRDEADRGCARVHRHRVHVHGGADGHDRRHDRARRHRDRPGRQRRQRRPGHPDRRRRDTAVRHACARPTGTPPSCRGRRWR